MLRFRRGITLYGVSIGMNCYRNNGFVEGDGVRQRTKRYGGHADEESSKDTMRDSFRDEFLFGEHMVNSFFGF